MAASSAGARRLTVADEMITYSLSGNALSPDARAELDRAIQRLASGEIPPPRRPTGPLTEPAPPPQERAPQPSRSDPEVTVTFTLAGRLGAPGAGVVKSEH